MCGPFQCVRLLANFASMLGCTEYSVHECVRHTVSKDSGSLLLLPGFQISRAGSAYSDSFFLYPLSHSFTSFLCGCIPPLHSDDEYKTIKLHKTAINLFIYCTLKITSSVLYLMKLKCFIQDYFHSSMSIIPVP